MVPRFLGRSSLLPGVPGYFGRAGAHVVALVTGMVLTVSSMAVVAAPARADSVTTLNLTTFSQMAVDAAHEQVFIAGGPTSNWIEVRGFDGSLKGTVAGQTGARGLALAPDGSAVYAALDGTGAVSRISTTTLSETARYPLGVGNCVSNVAFAGSTLYVSYGCTTSGRVAPLDLAAETPALGAPLPGSFYPAPKIAGDADGRVLAALQPVTGKLVRYDLTQTPVTSMTASAERTGSVGANCADLAVHPDGVDGIVACGSPYVHKAWSLSDLSLSFTYPTDAYPNAIAVTDSVVAAGSDGTYDPDIYLFSRNSDALIQSFELGGTTWELAGRGLALSPDGSKLFAVSESDSALRFHVFDNPFTPPVPLVGDTAFAKCLTDSLGLPDNHWLTESDLGKITTLDCTGRGIKDIAGADKLTALTELALDNNQIADLASLAGLTKLTSLTLSDNLVNDVSPLAGLTGLTVLGLFNNRIADLTPLADLTALEWLWMDGNHIVDLAPLAGLKALTWLTLERNQISDLTPVAGLTGLEQLWVANNRVGDLRPLAADTNLTTLYLESNQVSDLSPLAGLTRLKILWLADNQINSVRPLAALTALEDLYLERNHLLDLTGVKSTFEGACDTCGLAASDQSATLPGATVGVPFPLVVKDDLGEVILLTVPSGVTYANGALTYSAPGTYTISFDVEWFSGTITQVVQNPVTSATPKVSGSAAVGATVTALPGTWGPEGVALAYQWYRGASEIGGATSPTYVVQAADVGASLKVRVTGTAEGCASLSKTSAATGVVVKGVLSPVVVPKVSDTTPVTDQVLTADPGVWGPDPVALAFQWYRVSSTGTSTAISGATQATYPVKSGDVGYKVKVKVTGSKPGFTSVSKYSALTSAVATAKFTTTPAPVIAEVGTLRVGKKLTAVPGDYVPVQSKFGYQWYRGATAITGATASSYTLGSADKGQKIKVRVKAYRAGYATVTQYTAPTLAVQAGLTTVTPKVSDTTPTVDQVLTAIPGVWGPATAGVTFGYQWYRGTTAIPGATEATYTVQPADVAAT